MVMNRLIPKEDEYLENGIPFCKKCKTTRYFVCEEIILPCKCKCQQQEIERQEKIKMQEKKEIRMRELKQNSLLNKRYENANFENIEIINEEHAKIVKRLKTFCNDFVKKNNGCGIYLYGKTGSGKTLMAACMLDSLNSQFVECIFTNMFKLKQELFSTDIRRQKSFLDKITNVPVLFIDDFGTESVKKNGEDNYIQDIIYDIINTRYNNMMPIIYTSNYSLKQCVEDRGVLEKTIDRIYESTVQIKLELPSYRLRKKENIYF